MAEKKKERLDVLLVKRNLAESREKAKAYIMAGNVFVDGVREDKAGTNVPESAEIELRGMAMKYVSRGGFKLEKAVDEFGVVLDGAVCMDVGSSTGGFTDCMLQNGAVKVFAVDVGTNQLAWKLRTDERVVSMEQTNIRYVTPEDIGEQVDFVSIDVAFISLTKVLAPVYDLMKVGARIVCLIKPQFEAGREKVGKKGVVRERETHLEVIEQVIRYADSLGFLMLGLSFSPIRGPEGNIEYLLYMEKTKEQRADAVSVPGAESDEDGEDAESDDFEEIDAAFSVRPLSPEADELVRQADRITKEAHAVLDK